MNPDRPHSIRTGKAPDPVGPYPHARRVGDLLFLSGIGPRKPGTNQIPGVTLDAAGRVAAHDIEAQCRSAFENVRVILEAAGSSWDKIVDVTVFLTDMQADFDRFNRVYAEYFTAVAPARATVQVAALPGAGVRLQVAAIAVA